MTGPAAALPGGVTVFQRGWLSANNILLTGAGGTALVDSGYCTHAAQTVALVEQALGTRPLELLLNTHLHSDHCGGNAALQARFPGLRTLVPPGHARQVIDWDPVALTYVPTGQSCPRFRIEGTLRPGTSIALGDGHWEIHAAPGHDPHSVVLFEPRSRTLMSADALWQNGFGVVFPELEGQAAFDDVGRTLDLIERLRPAVVIPGHGQVFREVDAALETARRRLAHLAAEPARHAQHAAKVLLKFKLLELQRLQRNDFEAWALATPYFAQVHARWFAELPLGAWIGTLINDLERSGALRCEGDWIADSA